MYTCTAQTRNSPATQFRDKFWLLGMLEHRTAGVSSETVLAIPSVADGVCVFGRRRLCSRLWRYWCRTRRATLTPLWKRLTRRNRTRWWSTSTEGLSCPQMVTATERSCLSGTTRSLSSTVSIPPACCAFSRYKRTVRWGKHCITPHHNRFTSLSPGPPGSAEHPAGRHSIRANQCPPPSSSPYFYRPDALPAAQPTSSKHWRQLAHLN